MNLIIEFNYLWNGNGKRGKLVWTQERTERYLSNLGDKINYSNLVEINRKERGKGLDVGICFKWKTYDRLEFSGGGYNFGYIGYEKREVVDAVGGRCGRGRGKGKCGEAMKSRRDVVSVARTSSDSPSDCHPLCWPTRTNERMNSKTLLSKAILPVRIVLLVRKRWIRFTRELDIFSQIVFQGRNEDRYFD